MSTVINNPFTSGNWLAVNNALITTERVQKSFASQIARLMPNGSAPLVALSSQLKEVTAKQIEHGFFAKRMLFPSVRLNAIATISGNTPVAVTVVSSAEMIPGMVLRASTGTAAQQQTWLVTAVNSATQITVIPNIGGTTATSIPNTTIFYQIGNAMGEASTRPQSILVTTVRVSNYTQIFRNTWTISDTVRATQMASGDTNIAESRQECAKYHARDMEEALFFGRRQMLATVGSLGNGQLRMMAGLIDSIADTSVYIGGGSANLAEAGATTNWTQLESYLESALDAQSEDMGGDNSRVVFCGATALRVCNNISRINSSYQITTGATEYGLQFRTLKTTRGTFHLIEHPLFNSNANWARMAVVVDLPSVSIAYLRKTKTEDFNQSGSPVDNGIDAVGGTLTTECTLELRNPQGCAVITNLTAAVAG